MRVSSLATIVGIVFLLIVIVSRLLPVPFAIGVVASSSMRPTLTPGDLVIAAGRDISVGDIVIYCVDVKICIIHRVIQIYDGFIVTKGDALRNPDPPIPISKVKGKVVWVLPWWAWIIPLSLYVTYTSIDAIRRLAEGAEWHPYLVFVILFAATILLSHSDPWNPPKQFVPHIKLNIFDNQECVAIIALKYNGSIVGVYNVSNGWKLLYYNSTHIILKPVNLTALRYAAYKKQCMPLSFTVKLTRNITAEYNYCFYMTASRVKVSVICPHVLLVNDNCFPVNITLRFYGVVNNVYRVIGVKEVSIPPKSNVTIISPNGTVFVDVGGQRYACSRR